MRLRECSLLTLTLLTVSLPAQASQWYPLDTGRSWVYSGADGRSHYGTVEAPESFAGSLVQPLQWYPLHGYLVSRENLSQDAAGRVFHHGMSGSAAGGYVVFNPPFLRMESELTLGQEWEVTYEAIDYDASNVEVSRDQWHETFRVISVGPVDVPAGTFEAAEVLRITERNGVPWYTFRESYAPGVGYIRRTDETGIVFKLEAYWGGPLRTEAKTWGAVKALYRK